MKVKIAESSLNSDDTRLFLIDDFLQNAGNILLSFGIQMNVLHEHHRRRGSVPRIEDVLYSRLRLGDGINEILQRTGEVGESSMTRRRPGRKLGERRDHRGKLIQNRSGRIEGRRSERRQ